MMIPVLQIYEQWKWKIKEMEWNRKKSLLKYGSGIHKVKYVLIQLALSVLTSLWLPLATVELTDSNYKLLRDKQTYWTKQAFAKLEDICPCEMCILLSFQIMETNDSADKALIQISVIVDLPNIYLAPSKAHRQTPYAYYSLLPKSSLRFTYNVSSWSLGCSAMILASYTKTLVTQTIYII